MRRTRKQPDAVEMHERERSARENHSFSIIDMFPGVTSIRIDLTFEDFDEKEGPKPCQLKFSPRSRAFFELRCPYRECVMGGFNFSAAVRQAVDKQSSDVKGTKQCPGWQDRERVHKNGCYLKAHYEVHVEYRDP